jgi:hypothetical protein
MSMIRDVIDKAYRAIVYISIWVMVKADEVMEDMRMWIKR